MFSQLLSFSSKEKEGMIEIFMSTDINVCNQQMLLSKKLSSQDIWVLESTL